MAIWDLSQIRQKVRQVTGRLTEGELSNDEIDNKINQYYQYTFPAEVKLDKQFTFYELLTTPNQNTYTFDQVNFTNVVPPAYIDELNILYFQSPAEFKEMNPNQITPITPFTGNGTTTAFSTTLNQFPILQGTFILTDDNEVFEDTTTTWTDQNIAITGSLGGSLTLNLKTGFISVNFATAPENGAKIRSSYVLFNPGLPTSVLFYDNEFTFFPPPNTVYRFKIAAYKNPPALVESEVESTSRPLYDQWGPGLAYGAARDIHADFGEMESYKEVTALYKEQVSYILTRTEQNLLNTRSSPLF